MGLAIGHRALGHSGQSALAWGHVCNKAFAQVVVALHVPFPCPAVTCAHLKDVLCVAPTSRMASIGQHHLRLRKVHTVVLTLLVASGPWISAVAQVRAKPLALCALYWAVCFSPCYHPNRTSTRRRDTSHGFLQSTSW